MRSLLQCLHCAQLLCGQLQLLLLLLLDEDLDEGVCVRGSLQGRMGRCSVQRSLCSRLCLHMRLQLLLRLLRLHASMCLGLFDILG